jgi:6-hydroxymethylpterin diphosphokinase MptE-like
MNKEDPLLIDTGRGFSILFKDRYLYNSSNPMQRAVLKASKTVFQSDTLYFLSSPLLFYGLSELITNLPAGSHIICFEISDDLHEISKKYIPDNVSKSKSVSFIDNTNIENVLNKISELGIWNYRRVKLLNITGGYSLYASEYKSILDRIDNNIQEYWKNRMTLIHMGPLWIKNIFLNLFKLYKESNILLSSHFPYTNYPILVTGAGESIEKSITYIKKNRKYFKILTVDTALSILIENDIKPDYVIAVDAQIYNFYDFMMAKNSSYPLFFDISGYSGISSVMNGRLFPFISNFADTKLLNRLDYYNLLPWKIPALGSVGVTAVYIALKITSANVLFTGLDFAYKIGKSHAKGSPRNLSELSISSRINPMEQLEIYYTRPLIHNKDKNGNNCISDLILTSYADLLKNNFKDTQRLYDIGTSGLHTCKKPGNCEDLFQNTTPKHTIDSDKTEKQNKTGTFDDFLNNEMSLLTEVYEKTYQFLSGKSRNKEKLINILKEVDYIYMHFPDKSPEPSADSVFLKRILVSCGYYINILRKYIS